MVGGWLFYISFLSRSFFLSRLRFKALKLSWPGSAGGGGSGKREGRKRRRKKKIQALALTHRLLIEKKETRLHTEKNTATEEVSPKKRVD